MEPKARAVCDMFARISPRYDLLNRLLSLGIDRSWRRSLARALEVDGAGAVLDVACGTGDVALEIGRRVGPPTRVVGVDFCLSMLHLARRKAAPTGTGRLALVCGDGLALPFADGRFDRVSIAFGIRNVADLDRGLAELARVTSPGGLLGILEFSRPTCPPFRALYYLYFLHVLPLIGRLVSGDPEAYRYLPDSVLSFPERDDLARRLEAAGFSQVRHTDLTLGIVTLHVARRSERVL